MSTIAFPYHIKKQKYKLFEACPYKDMVNGHTWVRKSRKLMLVIFQNKLYGDLENNPEARDVQQNGCSGKS